MAVAPALVLGCTGLVGSHIVSTLRHGTSLPFSSVEVLARRPPSMPDDAPVAAHAFVEKETSKWAAHIASLTPVPSILFCALGTTRAAAGGFQNQYKIEHDLNIELAKAAKDAGTTTYVLISSTGADPSSLFGYTKMKGEIEEHVKALGFDHTIIVRPGMILGNRQEFRAAEVVVKPLVKGLGLLHHSLQDAMGQEPDVIAKAAVSAAVKANRGEVKDKVWILGQKDIVRLGRDEWKA